MTLSVVAQYGPEFLRVKNWHSERVLSSDVFRCILFVVVIFVRVKHNTGIEHLTLISCDLDTVRSTYEHSIFMLAGGLNNMNNDFLCDDYGLHQLVVFATHSGNIIIDKVFASNPGVCVIVRPVRVLSRPDMWCFIDVLKPANDSQLIFLY